MEIDFDKESFKIGADCPATGTFSSFQTTVEGEEAVIFGADGTALSYNIRKKRFYVVYSG
jgi:hypothetical protein